MATRRKKTNVFGTMAGGFTLLCVRIADGATLFEHLVEPIGAPMHLAMTLDGARVLCWLSSGVAVVLPYAALMELGRKR